MVKKTFRGKKVCTSKLNLVVKKKVFNLQCCALFIRTWTLLKGDMHRTEVFKTWIWRRMEQIS